MSIARGEPAETRVEPPQPSSPNGVEPIAKPVSSYHPPTVTSATKVLTALPENPSSSSAGLDEDVSSGEASKKRHPFLDRFASAFRLHAATAKEDADSTYDYVMEQRVKSLDDYWTGYGKLAAIEACDPNFLIYRKFDWLRNRVLLQYQDELAVLENQLEVLDRHDYRNEVERLTSRRRDEATRPRRKNLLAEIDKKLAEYDSLLLRLQTIHRMRRPTKRNQTSLFNMIDKTECVIDDETQWIHHGPDLAAVAHDHEYGWFQILLEDTLNRISRRFTKKIFRTKEQEIVTGREKIQLLSPHRLDVLLRGIITVLAPLLLLIPVWLLVKYQGQPKAQFGIILFSTIVFSLCCSVITKARRQEVFTATAAYSAVLVVFLGNTASLMASSNRTH